MKFHEISAAEISVTDFIQAIFLLRKYLWRGPSQRERVGCVRVRVRLMPALPPAAGSGLQLTKPGGSQVAIDETPSTSHVAVSVGKLAVTPMRSGRHAESVSRPRRPHPAEPRIG